MYHINLRIDGQRLFVTQVPIVSGSIGYIKCKVTHTPDWDNAEIMVCFRKDGTTYSIPTDNRELAPEQQINLSAGSWEVWCIGIKSDDGETIQKITTTSGAINVYKSAGEGGEAFPEVEATLIEKLLAKISAAVTTASAALGAAESAVQTADKRGMPPGGEKNQVLVKTSSSDYAAEWGSVYTGEILTEADANTLLDEVGMR